MNRKPLVSVLMTAYNRERFIADAIESVMSSSYENWELIIVDDCSTDKTIEIAREYEKKDNRITVYLNEKNLGDYPNRNKAAEYATGDYIKYLDSDDIIYPHGIEMLVSALEKFPQAAMAIMSIGLPEGQEPYPILVKPYEAYTAYFYSNTLLTVGPSGTMLRHNIFKKMSYFSGKNYVGDTELNLKIAAQYPIVRVPQGFFFWRQHDEQQIKEGVINLSYHKYNYLILNKALDSKACPLKGSEIIELKKRLNKRQARIIMSLARRRNFTKASELKREMKMNWMNICILAIASILKK